MSNNMDAAPTQPISTTSKVLFACFGVAMLIAIIVPFLPPPEPDAKQQQMADDAQRCLSLAREMVRSGLTETQFFHGAVTVADRETILRPTGCPYYMFDQVVDDVRANTRMGRP
jgi:hypothetical protein